MSSDLSRIDLARNATPTRCGSIKRKSVGRSHAQSISRGENFAGPAVLFDLLKNASAKVTELSNRVATSRVIVFLNENVALIGAANSSHDTIRFKQSERTSDEQQPYSATRWLSRT